MISRLLSIEGCSEGRKEENTNCKIKGLPGLGSETNVVRLSPVLLALAQ